MQTQCHHMMHSDQDDLRSRLRTRRKFKENYIIKLHTGRHRRSRQLHKLQLMHPRRPRRKEKLRQHRLPHHPSISKSGEKKKKKKKKKLCMRIVNGTNNQ